MRIAEVNLQPGTEFDPAVVEQLVALVPGQRAAQPGRKAAEGPDQGIADRLGAMVHGESTQDREPGLAFHQGDNRGPLPGPDEEIALPVADLTPRLDRGRSLPDRPHRGRLFQGAIASSAPAATMPVGSPCSQSRVLR